MGIKVKGLNELTRAFKKLEEEAPEMAGKLLNTLGEVTVGYVRAVTPVDTGKLKGATKMEVKDKRTVFVFNNEKHAKYVEFGTRKSMFAPVGSRMKGFFFMKRGLNRAKKDIPLIMDKYLKEWLKK